MKLRTGQAWMSAADYSRTLHGLSINLLVNAIEPALHFQREVLGAKVVYSDPDFAVLQGYGAEWILHADHTYDAHPLRAMAEKASTRGVGVELRLHGCDPDRAEAAARQHGYTVLADSADKPHGLREAYLLDPDGYTWVPDVPIT